MTARKKDLPRPLLLAAVGLLGLAAVLYVADWRALASWLVLAGALLTLVYFVVRRAARAPDPAKSESMLFGQSTSMQAPPEMDDRGRRNDR